jgi:colanic acid/amylovoran biosynthesis glycosyltransferase
MKGARLLVIGTRWPPETFITRKLQGLAARGFDITVATTSAGSEARVEGVQLRRMPSWDAPAPVRLARLASLLPVAVRSRRYLTAAWGQGESFGERLSWVNRLLPLAEMEADIVHFEWNLAAVAYLPLFDLFRGPTVVSCRGAHVQIAPHNPERASSTSNISLTFEKAAAVHCVSSDMVEQACALGLDRAKAAIIRPAVDPEIFCPAPEKPRSKQLRIVSTGSLIWRKGYEYALTAIRRLIDSGVDATYEIIGEGDKSERQRILYTIDDLGLTGAVKLAGDLKPGSVRERLQGADVFLLSSLSEGISNAVLEAMSCGVPVVATDCGGMTEAVTDGVEGFVTPVRDADNMGEALIALGRNELLRHRMGAAARQRVLRDFTLRRQIDQWVELYGRVMSGGRLAATA